MWHKLTIILVGDEMISPEEFIKNFKKDWDEKYKFCKPFRI